jgi:DNA-binding phage protein
MARKVDNIRRAITGGLHPLSVAIPTPAALSVLRVLSNIHARLSLRQVARDAGINHQTFVEVLAAMAKYRIVEIMRVGKSSTALLNESNAIVSELILPLLDKERLMVDDIGRDINRQFGALCRKIVFKDVATGVGTVDLVAADENLPIVRRLAEEMAAGLEERYGFDIDFRVHTLAGAPQEIV